MDEQQFIDLVAKKLNGSINSGDAVLLADLLKENSENQKMFDALQKQWEVSGKLKLSYQPDTVAAWGRFKGLRTDRDKKVVSLWPMLSKVAAVLVVAIGLVFYFFNADDRMIYSTAENEIREVELVDGSKVFLSESTTLLLAADFGEEERALSLVGEAFFEVARDETKPFKISSGMTMTEVLGTSFNINSVNEKEVLIDVVSGKVSFSKVGEELILTKNMSAKYDIGQNQLTQIVSNQNHLSRFTQKLVFDNTSMLDVVKNLQDYFEVSIKIETQDLGNCLFTGTFEKTDLEEILNVIALSLNIQYKKLNNSYVIGGSGCTQ